LILATSYWKAQKPKEEKDTRILVPFLTKRRTRINNGKTSKTKWNSHSRCPSMLIGARTTLEPTTTLLTNYYNAVKKCYSGRTQTIEIIANSLRLKHSSTKAGGLLLSMKV